MAPTTETPGETLPDPDELAQWGSHPDEIAGREYLEARARERLGELETAVAAEKERQRFATGGAITAPGGYCCPANDQELKTVPPRSEVLFEAEGLINGDRNVTYGSPTQNFTVIAELVTSRLRHKLAPGQTITATDVADVMVLVKVARNIAQTKRDNFVDIAGYAACGWETVVEAENSLARETSTGPHLHFEAKVPDFD